MPRWQDRPLDDLLAEVGVAGEAETLFETNGWSGAEFTTLRRGPERLVLKRATPVNDWIIRATRDVGVREAWIANGTAARRRDGAGGPDVGELAGDRQDPETARFFSAYLGAARGPDDGAAILMRDMSAELVAWGGAHDAVFPVQALDRLLDRIAQLHVLPWTEALGAGAAADGQAAPWCPLAERLTLLTRRTAKGYLDDGNPVGPTFLRGWEAFDERAPRAARDLVDRLDGDPGSVVAALGRLPSSGLHGDLKLANVAMLPDGGVALIDWQMTLRAPVAVELGWLLVSNSGELPIAPDDALERYVGAVRRHVGGADIVGSWEAQRDLTMVVGLLLRGWRKGIDAAAGGTLASGVTAADDLAWWCAKAVEAADRRL